MNRKRYCDVKAKTLEEILATCNRHIKNINLAQYDLQDNGDGSETDMFYINLFREVWTDLRDDVQEMIDGEKRSTAFSHVLECYKSGQVSERQFQEHLKDPLFSKWLEKHHK